VANLAVEQEIEGVFAELKDLREGAGERWEDRLRVVKAVIAAVSAWARIKQTEGAREAINFMIARELAQTPDFKEYLALALPNHGVVKALKERDGETH
jgi:hypothetical protein